MYPKVSIRHAFNSKFSILSFSLFLALFAWLQAPCLEAGGWGKTEKVSEYEGVKWNGVYFDMNGLYFRASIPNSSGAALQNNMVSLGGKVKGTDAEYVITTSLNKGFRSPRSVKEFAKMIQKANPSYKVTAIDAKKHGAKYGVDMVPKNQKDTAFWRFLATDDRLIKMGSGDTNENRRHHFFKSIHIR